MTETSWQSPSSSLSFVVIGIGFVLWAIVNEHWTISQNLSTSTMFESGHGQTLSLNQGEKELRRRMYMNRNHWPNLSDEPIRCEQLVVMSGNRDERASREKKKRTREWEKKKKEIFSLSCYDCASRERERQRGRKGFFSFLWLCTQDRIVFSLSPSHS